MRQLFISLLLLFSIATHCQTSKESYYLYNIVSFDGDFTKEDFKVYYDNGVEVKRFRNEQGNKMKFKTPAGALMYFLSQGWEMYLNGATSRGSTFQGTGGSSTSSYWILRKPSTKEEFEKAIDDAIVK